MTVGEQERAERKAKEILDKWIEVTGCIGICTSYYYELCSIIDDAVQLGAKAALGLPLVIDEK